MSFPIQYFISRTSCQLIIKVDHKNSEHNLDSLTDVQAQQSRKLTAKLQIKKQPFGK